MWGIRWNMVCSLKWVTFRFSRYHVQVSLFHLLSLAINSMGANASTAGESFYSRVILCILIPRIIPQVCKVHDTMNYSQTCFSWVCKMLIVGYG